MKYIFISLIALCTSVSLFAQKQAGKVVVHGNALNRYEKAVIDTAFNGFENYNPVIYSVPDTGGYVSGSNGYKDLAKAQELTPPGACYLTGAIFWFGKNVKNTGGDTSSVIFNYYRRDSVQLIAGTYKFVPGTILESDTVKLADVPADSLLASGMYVWNFTDARHIAATYFLGFDMRLMHANDSIALYTSTDGEVIAADKSWELWMNKWNTIENAWGLNIDLAIFPIYDITNVSIEDFDANTSFIMYPNPAQNEIFVNSNEAVKSISVLDLNGRVIMSTSNANQVNISHLPAATYLIKVETQSGKQNFGRFIKSN